MCPDPLTQVADRAILTVRGYENLALEGDMVDFFVQLERQLQALIH